MRNGTTLPLFSRILPKVSIQVKTLAAKTAAGSVVLDVHELEPSAEIFRRTGLAGTASIGLKELEDIHDLLGVAGSGGQNRKL
jgi:hypothetical protein